MGKKKAEKTPEIGKEEVKEAVHEGEDIKVDEVAEEDAEELDDEILSDEVEDETTKIKELQKENEELKIAIPGEEIKTASAKKATSTIFLTKDDIADKLSEQLEEEQERKDYKHLDVNIEEIGDNDYFVHIYHQAHGFMNYLLSKVLKIKGVVYAAYKCTSLEPAILDVKIDGSKDIKTIIKEASKVMRIELKGLGNAVASIKF